MRLRALSCTGVALAALAPVPAFGAWSAPTWVSARDGAAYSAPDVAAGAAGRSLAAFVRTPAGSPPGAARVQLVTRASARTAWSAPRVLSGRGARAPKVALNARGDAVVVWVLGRSLVAAGRRGPAGAWTTARVVVAGGPVQDLRVAIDRVGRPVVLWSERRGSGFLIRTAMRPSPVVPWALRAARLATPGPAPPSLAVSRAAALVAWLDGARTLAARTSGGLFEEPTEVSSEGRGVPGVGLSADGGMIAAWSVGLPGGTSVVLVSERGDTSRGWSASEDAGIGSAPLAAINDRGDAVLGWALAEAGSAQGIEASTRRAGGRWEAFDGGGSAHLRVRAHGRQRGHRRLRHRDRRLAPRRRRGRGRRGRVGPRAGRRHLAARPGQPGPHRHGPRRRGRGPRRPGGLGRGRVVRRGARLDPRLRALTLRH